jgi:peptidoglycan/xylan/chitin deacetylase (PgdA/CDA1 family)
MEFLHKNHYNVVGLDKIASYLEKREKMPPRTVAITFDDGYYNNYEYAYPILKKYNLPATIFVILKNVGKPGWLGWEEIREMSNSGIITIGSHTVSHAWLLDAKPDVLEKEVRESKMILEENMGKRVGLFCYPLGAFDKKAELYVEDAGYTCAVTTNPPKKWPANDIYAIKRIKISRTSDSLFIFWFKTSGYYTFVKESKGGY